MRVRMKMNRKLVLGLLLALALAFGIANTAYTESIVLILDGSPESCYCRVTNTETGQVTYAWYTPCPVGS